MSVHAHGRAEHNMTDNVLSLKDDNFVQDNSVAMTQERRFKRKDIWLTRLQYQKRYVKGEADEEHNHPQRRGGILLQQLRYYW